MDGEQTAAEQQAQQRIRHDVYIHFPGGIPITVDGSLSIDLEGGITVVVEQGPPVQLPPTHAVLSIVTTQGEKQMPGTIDISADDAGATAVLTFEDHLDDPTYVPLSSDGSTPAVVAYTTDNPAVATIDPTSGLLTEVSAGTVNVGATVDDAITGSPVLEPDGVTPFAPAPINVTVTPGAPVGDVFTVNA